MTLNQFLSRSSITDRDFAISIGVSIHAVRKWKAKTRIPRPQTIKKIELSTDGKVKPKDWFND